MWTARYRAIPPKPESPSAGTRNEAMPRLPAQDEATPSLPVQDEVTPRLPALDEATPPSPRGMRRRLVSPR
ncbi:hypothetical protein BHM03_00029152 [Ensete ventricosum]|nr:hypothetical protein BHM03_00029152 [Ensete ventricosum]